MVETDPEASGSGSTGTLVLADGTEITFEMSMCVTSDTAPNSFLVDPGYLLFGLSDDGYRLRLGRAGLDEGSASADAELENDLDLDVSYAGTGDEEVRLDVDGAHVTGTVLMTSIDSNEPLGPSIEATVDITC